MNSETVEFQADPVVIVAVLISPIKVFILDKRVKGRIRMMSQSQEVLRI